MLALSAALTNQGVTLRSERDDDVPFLRDLYASTRSEELARVPWTDAQKIAFLHDQFRLQRAHYLDAYRDASFDLVLAGEIPIGRLCLFRGATDHRVVDVALMPEWRGRGVGGALLRCVQAEAGRLGRSVSIHVERVNPAKRLYERLGFVPVEDKGIYLLLVWRSRP